MSVRSLSDSFPYCFPSRRSMSVRSLSKSFSYSFPSTGVCERLPLDHPTTTSTWCVWTTVHACVVTICSDQPVHDRFVVFDFVVWWKEGFVNMINRNFMRLLMMGVFSRVCSRVLGGMRESVVSDSGRRHWFFFWVGGIGNGKRRYHGSWSSSYVHCMS
jgi:hypothetical protein